MFLFILFYFFRFFIYFMITEKRVNDKMGTPYFLQIARSLVGMQELSRRNTYVQLEGLSLLLFM